MRKTAHLGAIGLLLLLLAASGLLAACAGTDNGAPAAGDLDARVEVRPHENPEFVQLAESINTMGGSLARARDQERQFLMSVSHELRTPLTSIRGYAEAVLDGATDDPHAAAAVISSEARRLERLVQALLDLARLDADRFTFDLRTVDAALVARQVVSGFQPRAADLG